MAKQKTATQTAEPKATGVNIPAALLPEIESGRTAYVSGEAWFFCEATAKKYFDKYETITPNDIK